MKKKAARTAEIHSSISRGQSVCRRVGGRGGSGIRPGMESGEDVLIDLQDCRRHDSTTTMVIRVETPGHSFSLQNVILAKVLTYYRAEQSVHRTGNP